MPYGNDEDDGRVTIFERGSLRPTLEENRGDDGVPSQVYFILPDGTIHPVDTSQDIIIGRQPREDDPPVTIDLDVFEGNAKTVSRQHAMIKPLRGMLVLVDLDSINGTFVNDHRALPTKRYGLYDGDELTFGHVTVQLRFEEPPR